MQLVIFIIFTSIISNAAAVIKPPYPLSRPTAKDLAAEQQAEQAAEAKAPEPEPKPDMLVQQDYIDGAPTLIFEWEKHPPLAVFHGYDGWWFVIKTTAKLKPPEKWEYLSGFHEISAQSQEKAQILYIKPDDDLSPRLKFETTGLKIRFVHHPLHVSEATQIRLPSAENGMILLLHDDLHEPINFEDTYTKENYLAFPSDNRKMGINDNIEFPFLQLIKTGQGVVIQQRVDNLEFNLKKNRLEIKHSDGMAFTSLYDRRQKRKARPIPRILSIKGLPERIKELIHDQSSQFPKKVPLDQQVVYLLMMGLGDEAMSKLRFIAHKHPEAEFNLQYRAFAGLAEILAGNFERAHDLLHRLNSDQEVNSWSKIVEAAHLQSRITSVFPENRSHALAGMRMVKRYLEQYPKELHERLICLIAYSAVTIGDFTTAQYFIAQDKLRPKDPDEIAVYDYAKARLLIKLGLTDRAQAKFKNLLETSTNHKILVEAELNHLYQKYRNKELKIKELLPKLDQLRFRWRGDAVEYRITKFLADMHWQAKNFPEAMRLFKVMIEYFPNLSTRDKIHERLRQGFLQFFAEHIKNSTNPLTIPTFYQEFQSLTPEGELGDEIIFKVADQLEFLGLWDMAADLMTRHAEAKHPFKERRKRFELLIKVAKTHLSHDNPDAGLRVLEYLSENELRKIEIRQLRELRSRLLAHKGKVAEAVELIAPYEDHNAIKLRSKILTDANKWEQADKPMEDLIQNIDAESNFDKKVKAVMDLAYTRAVRDDKYGLRELRQKYSKLMKASDFAKEFELVTTQNETLTHLDRPELMERLDDLDKVLDNITSVKKQATKPLAESK